MLSLFLPFVLLSSAGAAPKIDSWTLYLVPILTPKTQGHGGLTLRLVNNVMPHFDESATSTCNLEERDGKNLLICTSATLRYHADENDGIVRIRRSGSITFNPVGSCSDNICLVSPLPLGSETYTQWVWFNTYWLQVGQFTQPIDWTDSSYPFDQSEAETGQATIGVNTDFGAASWSLFLVVNPH